MTPVILCLISVFINIGLIIGKIQDTNPEDVDLLPFQETIKNSPEKKTDTSEIKNIEFLDSNKHCYSQIMKPLLMFLTAIGHPFQEEDIKIVQVYSKQPYLDASGIPRMLFKVILNLNRRVEQELEGKRFTKTFTSDKNTIPLEIFLTSKYLDYEHIKNAKLSFTFKNFDNKQKSRIEILLEIKAVDSTSEVDLNKIERNTTNGIKKILNVIPNQYMYQRNLLKKEPFKFGKFSPSSTKFGLFLAVSSCYLCGLSLVLKKKSLLKLDKEKNYYHDRGWWMAHSLMVIGDILHFIAFFFAPAVLVCTLQVLMVIVVAISSSYILGEKVNTYYKQAFALSLCGCLVLIVHVPKESHIYSINAFLYIVTTPPFLIYNFSLLLITIIMMTNCIPKYSRVNSLAYTVQSAVFGSIIVIGLKGILLAFTDNFFHWLPWTCFFIVGSCYLLQLDYLNRALTYYNTLVVTTQYYVLYSAFVIMSSSILYEVWQLSSVETIIVVIFGFVTTVMGVLIFAIFQEDDAVFDFSKLFAVSDAILKNNCKNIKEK